jgi:repressor LexA
MVRPSSRPKPLHRPPGETRARVLDFVRDRLRSGRPPTIREVQSALGFRAVQTAREHLERLVTAGLLLKEEGRSRGYHLPEQESTPTLLVPLLGRVQAGDPTEAIEDREGFVPVGVRRAGKSLRKEKLFALRVQGESMRDAGILPGDIVIVEPEAQVQSGDVVVAMVDGEATVKTLRRVRGKVELHPANPDFEPIVPKQGEELRLVGKVLEVRRYLDGGV